MVSVIPMASVTPGRIVFYDYLEGVKKSVEAKEKSLANLADNSTKGTISKAAQRRLTQSVNWLHTLSTPKTVASPETGKSFRLRTNLITLTLSATQRHPDTQIKRALLNRLLEQLRESYDMKAYVWRAEPQKNGNIHFHLATNIFIHHKNLRDRWNNIQNKLGYIDAFERQNGHRDPNSTDVHKAYNVKDMAAYLAKYIAKKEEGRPIEGRLWYISQSLSQIKPIQIIMSGQVQDELTRFQLSSKWRRFDSDYASVVFADIFTSNLSTYPALASIRQQAFTNYQHLIQ